MRQHLREGEDLRPLIDEDEAERRIPGGVDAGDSGGHRVPDDDRLVHSQRLEQAAALLDIAERRIAEDGTGALALRDLAHSAGTTTRAIYSLFGSKDGLLAALASGGFEKLREGLDAVPVTADPRGDLIEAALMFRRFALGHPALFSICFPHADPALRPRYRATQTEVFAVLEPRFQPLAAADLLGGRATREAATQFHALWEGLAALELRHSLVAPDPERIWRDAFRALITGFCDPVQP
jgi:AcrR family transcriptional regulator